MNKYEAIETIERLIDAYKTLNNEEDRNAFAHTIDSLIVMNGLEESVTARKFSKIHLWR